MERTLWLIILTLSQAVLIALQIIKARSNKRSKHINNTELTDPPPCKEHLEKLTEDRARLICIERNLGEQGKTLAEHGARLVNVEKAVDRIEQKINRKD